jgi:hypothetical protein
MANLAREPKQATTAKPKMQSFKMGLQSKHRHAKRLSAMSNQTFVDGNGKHFHHLTIDRVYSHESGELTGSLKHFGKVIHVMKNNIGNWVEKD